MAKRPCRSRTTGASLPAGAHHVISSRGHRSPPGHTFTVGIVGEHGVEIVHETFANTAAGYGAAIDLLNAHRTERVGVEGSAKRGAHVAIALAAAGFDAREVPASRSAAQRRSRRLDKTVAVDAVASARALLAEPSLGPVQALEAYDPLVAETEAVLEHRRALISARTLMLHHAADQIAKLPTEVRDQLSADGEIEGRLRRRAHIESDCAVTPSGAYRLERLQALIDQHRAARRQIRRLERLTDERLDRHGTTPSDEPGIGTIAAATLACEVGDPRRFDRESKSARWSGTGAVALSSGEGTGTPVKHRLDFRGNRRINSVLHTAPATQQRSQQPEAVAYLARKATEGKTRRESPAEPTKDNSPTEPPAECGTTKTPENNPSNLPLDKEASDRPSLRHAAGRGTRG